LHTLFKTGEAAEVEMGAGDGESISIGIDIAQ
jgi:hypothetical protein